MSKETKVVSEVGIIGQMYEDRKTKKVGVLESREEKFKTLMMRDKDGKTFNINYSTFKSNWRKYNGEQIAQTSTQIEEKRAEEKKKQKDNKKVVESKPEVVKMTTEEKVKALRALEDVISSTIKARGLDFKTFRITRGAVVVRYKKNTLFEVWTVYAQDKYSFRMKETLDKHIDKDMIGTREFFEKETRNNIRRRVDMSEFEKGLAYILDASVKFVEEKEKAKEEKDKEKKNKESK